MLIVRQTHIFFNHFSHPLNHIIIIVTQSNIVEIFQFRDLSYKCPLWGAGALAVWASTKSPGSPVARCNTSLLYSQLDPFMSKQYSNHKMLQIRISLSPWSISCTIKNTKVIDNTLSTPSEPTELLIISYSQ